jgi:diaminopimelate epimerase
MRFSTWHALGNRYLLAEQADLTPERVRELVAGADGIVEVLVASHDSAEVVIWNPDGTKAELSGNGTRIAARWLAASTGADLVRIRVGGREVVARMLGGVEVEQDIGDVEVGAPERLEIGGEAVDFVPVAVGNPHAVVSREPERGALLRLGPLIERHPRFPNRTNVQFARVDGPGEVTAVVWERGVGETSASGTSAVAVAAACVGEGDVVVHFPGGDLRVRLDAGRAFLTGPAERID